MPRKEDSKTFKAYLQWWAFFIYLSSEVPPLETTQKS